MRTTPPVIRARARMIMRGTAACVEAGVPTFVPAVLRRNVFRKMSQQLRSPLFERASDSLSVRK